MIEILMATYNGENFIEEQLKSIENQDYKEWKLLIRDDGSTDQTMEIVRRFCGKHPQKVTVIEDKSEKKGSKYNFHTLLKASEAEYIMFCDQDDIWEKDKVSSAYKHMEHIQKKYNEKTPILCHSDLKVTDSKLNIINDSMFDMQKMNRRKKKFRDYLVQNNVTGCTVIMNRALAQLCKEMPDEAIMHDWWYALIAAAFGKVCYMGEGHILYRQHGNNTEGAKNLKSPVYLLKKLFDRKEVKRTLGLTYRQAEAFRNQYADKMDKEVKEIADAYISLENMGKLKKYRMIKKYGFMKSGLARKIGYLFFI